MAQLTKEDLQKAEKKKILELFVENDNTLSHLLEFISNKLMPQAFAPQSQMDSTSQQPMAGS